MGRECVAWWNHCPARAEEDSSWVTEGQGSHENGQRCLAWRGGVVEVGLVAGTPSGIRGS